MYPAANKCEINLILFYILDSFNPLPWRQRLRLLTLEWTSHWASWGDHVSWFHIFTSQIWALWLHLLWRCRRGERMVSPCMVPSWSTEEKVCGVGVLSWALWASMATTAAADQMTWTSPVLNELEQTKGKQPSLSSSRGQESSNQSKGKLFWRI